jgi:hypothetical protein
MFKEMNELIIKTSCLGFHISINGQPKMNFRPMRMQQRALII